MPLLKLSVPVFAELFALFVLAFELEAHGLGEPVPVAQIILVDVLHIIVEAVDNEEVPQLLDLVARPLLKDLCLDLLQGQGLFPLVEPLIEVLHELLLEIVVSGLHGLELARNYIIIFTPALSFKQSFYSC